MPCSVVYKFLSATHRGSVTLIYMKTLFCHGLTGQRDLLRKIMSAKNEPVCDKRVKEQPRPGLAGENRIRRSRRAMLDAGKIVLHNSLP